MTKIKRTCKQCGKIFETSTYRIKCGRGKFCSKKCYDAHRMRKVHKICKYCKKEFDINPGRARDNKGVFCSKECQQEYNKTKRIKCICMECGKTLFRYKHELKRGRKIFCSSECKYKWHSRVFRGKNNPAWKSKVECICKECGKYFEVHPYRIKEGVQFCSMKCKGMHLSRDTKNNKRLQKMRLKQKIPKHTTKIELKFKNMCGKYKLPFKFVGDGNLWVGENPSLNPDFIHSDGKHILVEIMGQYWHSPLLNPKMNKHGTLKFRKEHFKKNGWQSIFLWEVDLKREDTEAFVLSELKKAKVI